MKIGLALSGGGFRATVFHLGVLARLAEDSQLEDVAYLSTVSGGSLCVGLIYALNDFRWPASQDFIKKVVPEARIKITTEGLQQALIWRTLRSWWNIFETRADDLSILLQKHWGVTARLNTIPSKPRWMINATCSETGKNWRFENFRMGDYLFGYTSNPDIPLSDALAASAGFPGLIGPLFLDAKKYSWFNYKDQVETLAIQETHKARKTVPSKPLYLVAHLWDGGVYDNHGLEGLHNFETGWQGKIEFLIVSDGVGRSKPEKYRRGAKALLRIATGIMMDQIRSLRTRVILERLINHRDEGDRGSFLQIGNTCNHVLQNANREDEIPLKCPNCLPESETRLAENMMTEIRSLTQAEYERLFRHGFEVADYTLYAYNEDKFQYIGYANSSWG